MTSARGAAARPLRIGLAFLRLDPPHPGGPARYFTELAAALLRVDRQSRYILYLGRQSRGLLDRLPTTPRVRIRFLPISPTRWERGIHQVWPRLIAQDRLDVLHATTNLVPLHASCPVVVTIHDTVVLHPGASTRRYRQGAALLRLAVRAADALVTPSEHARRDLIAQLHVPPSSVTAIHHAPAAPFRPLPVGEAAHLVERRFGIRPPFFLMVAAPHPTKNHDVLVRALRLLIHRHGKPVTLVLAGPRGRGLPEPRALPAPSRLCHVGEVTDDELRLLYAAATAVVVPSRWEGFGLAALEGMACGAPVVASRCTSLPEVVGSAGLLVAPGSVYALARALERLLSDPRLCQSLRRRGLARARRFTWEATARRTLQLYRRIVAHPRRP